jgi:hypothetical protein
MLSRGDMPTCSKSRNFTASMPRTLECSARNDSRNGEVGACHQTPDLSQGHIAGCQYNIQSKVE